MYSRNITPIIYFEALECDVRELESKKSLKLAFLDDGNKLIGEVRVLVPKDAKMSQVIQAAKEKRTSLRMAHRIESNRISSQGYCTRTFEIHHVQAKGRRISEQHLARDAVDHRARGSVVGGHDGLEWCQHARLLEISLLEHAVDVLAVMHSHDGWLEHDSRNTRARGRGAALSAWADDRERSGTAAAAAATAGCWCHR